MAYREVGVVPPCIVWCDGPVSLATSWASASSCVGANASEAIIAAPYRQAVRRLDMHTDPCVTLLLDRFRHDCSCAVSAAMCAAVIEDADAVRPSVRTWLHRLRSSLADRRWPPGFAAVELPTRDGVRSFRCVPEHLRTPSEALTWLIGPPRSSGERHRQASG